MTVADQADELMTFFFFLFSFFFFLFSFFFFQFKGERRNKNKVKKA